MQNIKRSLLVGATLATVTAAGISGVGLASAATTTSTDGSTSLVDKLATKFNLKKADVQAVLDADHQARDAEREAAQQKTLADAVTAGKLTQEQADHITAALSEIKTLRGTTSPQDLSQTVKDQIKTKMDELRTWADTNNIDKQYMMPGRGGHDGHGGMGGERSSTGTTSTSTRTN